MKAKIDDSHLGEKHNFIITLILQYWAKFLNSDYGKQNPYSFLQSLFRTQYIFKDFEKISQAFLTEISPYREMLRDLFYLSEIASIVLITKKENYFNLPFDFLRFNAFLGCRNAEIFFDDLKKTVKNELFNTLEDFIGFLNKELYFRTARLTKTDMGILRNLAEFHKEYLPLNRPLTRGTTVFSKKLSVHSATISRSLLKMMQLGVLKYTAYVNYAKLGLNPYLTYYDPKQFEFNSAEETFIPLMVSTLFGEKFAIILIPQGLETRLIELIPLIPLKKFATFWDFTTYAKTIKFPKLLRGMAFFNNKTIIFPPPLGISFDYQVSPYKNFSSFDLEIIYELTMGRSTQVISEQLKEKREEFLGAKSWTHKKIKSLLENKIVFPYFYVAFMGLHSQCFIFAKGSKESINQLENLLRFMISVRHYHGQTEKGDSVLLSIVRMPPSWQHDFYDTLHTINDENLTIKTGWFAWKGAFRRIYLSQLWNDKDQYWNFPYYARK